MLPGRRKLAEEYGVALSTVQRAIARMLEDGTLTADGPNGTFVAQRKNGTVDPEAIRSDIISPADGPRRSTLRIGIMLCECAPGESPEETEENSFFGPLFDGIRSVLAREDVYVSYLYDNGARYDGYLRRAECDGLIVVGPAVSELITLQQLASENIPFVALLNSSDASPAFTDLPCIDADNRQGTDDALRHLVELGHKRIGIVNLSTFQTNLYDRLAAYFEALAEAGLSICPEHVLMNSFPWDEGVFQRLIDQWVGKLVRSNRLPTAIFACDFNMTLKTVAALQRLGVRVPDDVSVAGFDDAPVAEHLWPPLTMVRQPVYQMGRRAATRLLEHLKTSRGHLHGTERLPTQLIVRGSTAAPRPERL